MKVLFCGSFSPWHHAHQYVYDVACKCFGKDNVWIGVGRNKSKPKNDHNISFSLVPITRNVIEYEGLTADLVKKEGFDILVRGIRPGKSLEQEEELLHWNRKLSGVETLLIPTPPELNQISSSVIRELDSYKVDVLEYLNPDVFYRWKYGSPSKIIYFGKSCSGKSTFLKENNLLCLDCDKMIWDFVQHENKEALKSQMINAFINKDRHPYNIAVQRIGSSIDWELFFLNYRRIDAAVIGVYWDFIPIKIRSQFELVKIETTLQNRMKFAKKRNKSLEFIESADFFYKDPPFYDKLITIRENDEMS